MTLRKSKLWSLILSYIFFFAVLGIHPVSHVDATVYSVAVTPKFKAFEPGTWNPLASGKLYTYLPGTTTLTNTYKDYAGATLNTNPVILDANGECDLFYSGYLKLALYDANNVLVWTKDNIPYGGIFSDITGPGTGSITGFNIPLYLSDYLSVYDALTAWVDVRAYGAVNNTNMQTAIDANPGAVIFIPAGNYTFTGTITLPNIATRIVGDNAVINQTGSVPSFLQTNHVYTEISGIRFTGNGNGFKFNATPTTTMFRDFLIDRCQFATDSGVYGIYLYGPRTGYIQNSLFEGAGNGIYLQSVCLPFVVNTTFKGTDYLANAIIYDGDGLATSCGIGIRDSEILGFDNGVIIRYADWGNISGSTIDYNNNSIRLESTESVNILGGNYIGSVGDNAAIWIGQGEGAVGTPDYSAHILISSNTILGHKATGTDFTTIRITEGSEDIRIIGNNIHFYNKYGIWADNTTFLNISNNYFAERTGVSGYSVYRSGSVSDSSWFIVGNSFGRQEYAINGMSFAKIKGNVNFYNEWSGTKITDNAATTWYVPHLLDVTPDSVTISQSANHPVWVDNVTSTGFTINTDNTYAAFSVYWHARKSQGN